MAHRRHRLSFRCRDVFRRPAEYRAGVGLFSFLGRAAQPVHHIRHQNPLPQQAHEAGGSRAATARAVSGRRMKNQAITPFQTARIPI